MKRVLTGVFVICLLLFGAAAAEQSDFAMNGSTLTAYTGSGGDVVIPADMGVTEIGYQAFLSNNEITSLVIPDGVTKIDAEAFYGCTSMAAVDLPQSLRTIGYSAFQNCYALESIDLPEGLQSIGSSAFFSCGSLKHIELPDSIRTIESMMFSGCESLASVKLPAELRQIEDSAFGNCTALKELHIPAGVRSVGSYALEAANLEKLVIPETVCGISDLAISNGLAAPVVYCYEYSPAETWALEIGLEIVLMDGKSFSQLGGSVSLADMRIAVGRSEALFAYIQPDSRCFARTYASSAPEIVSVDASGVLTAHRAGSAQITLTIEGVSDTCTVTAYEEADAAEDFVVSGTALVGYTGTSAHVEIPAYLGITTIANGAFSGNSVIQSIVIPEGVTVIEDGDKRYGVFAGCYALRSVTLPSTLGKIGNFAFYECSGLEQITLPEGLETIGRYAFYGCGTLESVNLPQGLTGIGESAFAYCASLRGEFAIPAGVTSIEADTFNGCQQITRIALHDGVMSIGIGAFRNCESLVEINIPEGVTELPYLAFYGCGRLRSLVVPDSVTKIGNAVFGCCDSLVDLRLPEVYETTGEGLFQGCAFERWAVPEGLTSIPYDMFSSNENLMQIDIPPTVTELGDWSITLQGSMESFTVPDGVTRIGDAVFMNCPKLTKIYIPDSVTSFGSRIAFMGIKPYDKKPTIYCSKGSAAETWAIGEGFPVVYTEGKTFKQLGGMITLPARIELVPGDTVAADVRRWPERTADVPEYDSSDESVFTVDETGVLTAHACGTAELTVTLGGVTATASVHVYTPVSSFSLADSVIHMAMKENGRLRVTDIRPSAANEPLTFFVDDQSVLSIDQNGYMTAKGAGKACVTVKASGGYTDSCIVYVHQPETLAQMGSMKLNYSEWVLALSGLDGDMRLEARLEDGSGVSGLVYTSSDDGVATVDEGGVVSAVSQGRATITARSSLGLSASCGVIVEGDLAAAVLPASLVELREGAFEGNVMLEAVVLPGNMESVGAGVFAGCGNLRYVVIPETVENIAEDAFSGCDKLSVLCDASSYAEEYAQAHGYTTYIRN